MALKLITDAAAEPITLAEAKAHLRVEVANDDALIGALISAARKLAEHELGRSLITQTWEKSLDAFPAAEIELPRPPIAAVTSVKYVDTAGTQQTMSNTLYSLDSDSEPGWLLPAYGTDWPDTLDTPNAVRVRYTAGYGADGTTVPTPIKQWMLLQIGAMYENREAVATVANIAAVPFADRLLDPYRVWAVA